jgi:hypothetical protein
VEFNLKRQLTNEQALWAIQFGFFQKLQLDAIEWTW